MRMGCTDACSCKAATSWFPHADLLTLHIFMSGPCWVSQVGPAAAICNFHMGAAGHVQPPALQQVAWQPGVSCSCRSHACFVRLAKSHNCLRTRRSWAARLRCGAAASRRAFCGTGACKHCDPLHSALPGVYAMISSAQTGEARAGCGRGSAVGQPAGGARRERWAPARRASRGARRRVRGALRAGRGRGRALGGALHGLHARCWQASSGLPVGTGGRWVDLDASFVA